MDIPHTSRKESRDKLKFHFQASRIPLPCPRAVFPLPFLYWDCFPIMKKRKRWGEIDQPGKGGSTEPSQRFARGGGGGSGAFTTNEYRKG